MRGREDCLGPAGRHGTMNDTIGDSRQEEPWQRT